MLNDILNDIWNNYRGRLLCSAFGLFIGVMVLWLGFFQALFLLVCIGLGFFIGYKLEPSPGNGNTATRQTVAERQKQLLHGATLQEKMEEFKRKMEEMKAKMNAMQPDPSATPETQRDFICARKVTVKSMSKNVWICNWCHCQHNDPSECYREDLGGEWTYSYRYHDVEIIS